MKMKTLSVQKEMMKPLRTMQNIIKQTPSEPRPPTPTKIIVPIKLPTPSVSKVKELAKSK